MAVLPTDGLDADREAEWRPRSSRSRATEAPDGVDLTARQEMNLAQQLRIANPSTLQGSGGGDGQRDLGRDRAQRLRGGDPMTSAPSARAMAAMWATGRSGSASRVQGEHGRAGAEVAGGGTRTSWASWPSPAMPVDVAEDDRQVAAVTVVGPSP